MQSTRWAAKRVFERSCLFISSGIGLIGLNIWPPILIVKGLLVTLPLSPFFRGRRQGRQPLNPAMPRRVVWEAKHSFSYPGARPCRRPSPKILQPAGVFTFLGVRGGKKEGKIWRCVLEVLVGRFLVDFWSFFLFFWYCPRVKIV